MTGQEPRDDEREALVAEANRACAPGVDRTGVGYEIDLIRRLADALARKHPEPEITEARVDALAKSWLNYDGPLEDVDVWGDQAEWLRNVRAKARAALEAALRVPVGEGEQ